MSKAKRTALVTGASGLAGGYLLAHLLEQDVIEDLACFRESAADLSKVTAPLVLHTAGRFGLSFADVTLAANTGDRFAFRSGVHFSHHASGRELTGYLDVCCPTATN